MAVNNDKRAALIAEGLTEGEADYLASGGTKAEGLTPDAGSSVPASPPAAPARTEVRDGDAPPAAPATPAAPAAAPVTGAPPATPPEPDDDDLPQNTPVPYQRFKREKDRAQRRIAELTQQLGTRDSTVADLQQKWSRLDERFKVFREATETIEGQQQPQQPAAPPDPEADPFGYMRWLGEQVTGLKGSTEQVQTQVQERDAASALETAYTGDARAFVRTQPDFGQAYLWLMQNRDAELTAAGYTDQAERARIILADERDIVARALQARGTNPQAAGPAQILYNLAKARGYQPRAAAPANGNGAAAPAPNGNGAAAAPSVTEQVEQIARGQAASRSLSSAGGSPPPAALDLTKLSEMSDDEFAAWRRQLSPAQFKEYSAMLGAAGR